MAPFQRVRDRERHQQFKSEIADFMASQLIESIRLGADEALGGAQTLLGEAGP